MLAVGLLGTIGYEIKFKVIWSFDNDQSSNIETSFCAVLIAVWRLEVGIRSSCFGYMKARSYMVKTLVDVDMIVVTKEISFAGIVKGLGE